MSSHEKHCRDCYRALGKPFPGVHHWLDELFKHMGPRHREWRHHTQGVEYCRKRWGDEGAKAAEIHILEDFPHLKEVPKPEDYVDGWPGEQVVAGTIIIPKKPV